MLIFQYFVVVVVIRISKSEELNDNAAELLWQLSKYAVESRQKYPSNVLYDEKYPSYDQDVIPDYQYGIASPHYQYHQNPQENTNQIPSQYLEYPYRRYPQKYERKESFMDILSSVVRNDNLECVPKIICEVTSGTMSGRQQGFKLPINFNMESLLGFMTILNGAKSSPILHFGKAALLGVSSKGNAASCNTAYPNCPSDSDKLVHYLNNHNGGFFRYFNGNSVKKPRPYRYPKKYQQYRPTYQNYLSDINIKDYYPEYYEVKVKAQQRIQTNPGASIYNNNNLIDNNDGTTGFRFPSSGISHNFETNRNPKGLTFNGYGSTNKDFITRDPVAGAIAFPNDYDYGTYSLREPHGDFYDDQLIFPKPLRDHNASPMIFPTRTGTGQLILDAEELENNYDTQDNRYFVNTLSNNYVRGGRGLVFPQ